MFNNWNQVEDWVRDNHLDRWIFTLSDRNNARSEGGMPNDKIVDSEYYGDTLEDKLAITKKRLEECGRRVYGQGWVGKKLTDGMCCEVMLQPTQFVPQQQIGMPQSEPFNKEAFAKELRAQWEADMKLQRYEDERKQFEREKKEFEHEKHSAVGLLIGYLKPVLGAMTSRNVAGVDAPGTVPAARIVPVEEQASEQVEMEHEVFTDEEADRLFALMERFKKVEPQYMELIESVVTMAEQGDQTYTMARGFLIK